jgi:hypothetical protein
LRLFERQTGEIRLEFNDGIKTYMSHFRRLAKFTTFGYSVVFFSFLFLAAQATLAQIPPNLGTAATYGAFSGNGAIGNTGLTVVHGDIGTYVGSFTGFPPGQYTGAKHVADAAALSAKNDLILAYNSLNDAVHIVMYDTALNATMGNGQVLTPRTYGRGDLTTLSGNLTFDAKGNASAVFIIKIAAALNVAKNTTIILANGAQAANIYWAVDGAVSILDNSIYKGTILSNGAIHLYGGSSLEGRALAVVGAVTMASNVVTIPGSAVIGNTLVIITPAPGDSVKGASQNYQITWAGTGIASKKTFEYSLDSGATWKLIGSITADTFAYAWSVPDTSSTKALVRITDANNLQGVSGAFTIESSKSASGSIAITNPGSGDVITGGQNYKISWTATGPATTKTIELSLDGGLTWTMVGTALAGDTTFTWSVPDTLSTGAIIRITDQNGLTANSSIFSIKKAIAGALVVITPAQGEVIAGGTGNYQITFTAANTTLMKTFEYSLDGGATWSLIGVLHSNALSYSWSSVPNVATTTGLIRITDSTGMRGTSGLFTITKTTGVGSIDDITLTGLDNQNNIGNNLPLGISWMFTPDIGTSVNVEYSLDYGITWNLIAIVLVSESSNTSWTTPQSGVYNSVFIRLTSTKGMTKTSAPFSIGLSNSSVAFDAQKNAYSASNYPNPASDETIISLVLPVPSEVTLTIIDAIGREVRRTATQHFDAGSSKIPINTMHLGVGMYTYILQAGTTKLVGKMNIFK